MALLDTGAHFSIVSEKFFKRLNLPLRRLEKTDIRRLCLADGKPVDILGKVDIAIKINGLAIPFECRVLPNIAYDLILGLDFMETTNAQIDFKQKLVTFYDDMTAASFASLKKEANVLFPKCSTVLPPHCEVLVPMSVPKYLAPQLCLIEPVQPRNRQNFLLARALVHTFPSATMCRVLNPTDRTLWISKRRPLATIEPVSPRDIFDEPPAGSVNPNTDTHTSSETTDPHAPSVMSVSAGGTTGDSTKDSNRNSPVTLDNLGLKHHSEWLTATQNQKLKDLLDGNMDVFAKSLEDLQGTDLTQHTIHTTTEVPIRQRCYRHSAEAKREIDSQVEQMLKAEVIEPSQAVWGSPVVLVKKKSGEIRFCVDFRKINKITIPINFPLPNLTDVFDALADAQPTIFSVLDLKSGYHQILLDPATKEKTTFVTHSGQYQFLRLPFGLSNAPASFMSLMAHVFKGMTFQSVLCYLDDILVFSKDFESHLLHLQEVFDRLRTAKLKLHPKKCSFGLPKVLYLGHYLSAKGIEVDQTKVKLVEDYPRPKTQKDVRAFLGLAGYYRRFIQGFSIIANPLHQMLRKDVEFLWDVHCEEAFSTLKNALCCAPVLVYPDLTKPFIINCDASTIGIGYILAQEDSSGKEHPICYGGRSLTAAERNYSITHLECLSLVEAIREFNCYLANSYFTVFTDHISLKFLQSLKSSTTGRLLRWSLLLQGYHFEIQYKSGRKNTNADAISRLALPPSPGIDTGAEDAIFANIEPAESGLELIPSMNAIFDDELVAPDSETLVIADIAAQQRLCPDAAPIIDYLENGTLPADDADARKLTFEANEYVLHGSILYHYFQPRSRNCSRSTIRQLVIPQNLRGTLLKGFHEESSHPGFHRCYLSLRQKYFWKRMHVDVQDHIASCESCQKCKYPINSKKNPLQSLPIREVFGRWHMDILVLPKSNEGFRYLLLFVESLTRFPEAFPMKDQRAETIAEIIYSQIITRYGAPKSLLSDRGANFLSNIVAELSRTYGIHRLHTSGFRPQTNGACERVNRHLWQSLRILCTDQQDWPRYIPTILFSIRAVTSARLNYSPFYLMHGTQMRLGIDVALPNLEDEPCTTEEHAISITKRLAAAHQEATDRTKIMQESNKRAHDKNVAEPSFQPGDLVWLMTPQVKKGLSKKLSLRYAGPYYVTSKIGNHTFMLRHNQTNRVLTHPVNAERLKPFKDRRDCVSTPTDNTADEPSGPPTQRGTGNASVSGDDNDSGRDTPTGPEEKWHSVNRLLALKKVGKDIYFKVEWSNKEFKNEWIHERDITDALKREFYVTRTKSGHRRKRRN